MSAALFAKMLSDKSVLSLKKLHYKYVCFFAMVFSLICIYSISVLLLIICITLRMGPTSRPQS